MANVLRQVFNIYPGETKRALLFAGLAFIASLGIVCGSKIAEALFLLHVGAESLPSCYVAAALGSMGIATVLLYAYHHFSAYRVFLSTMLIITMFYSVVLLFMVSGIGIDTKFLWYVLNASGEIFFINLLTGFWSFIDQYHHLQDAKRLYAFFSSALLLGIAASGGIIQLGIFDLNTLYAMITGFLLLGSFWIMYIARVIQPIITDHQAEGAEVQEKMSWSSFIKTVLSSRMALLLLSVSLIVQLLYWVTEFNYMSAFERQLTSGRDVIAGEETSALLTRFLGRWSSIVAIGNIAAAVFLYGRLVKRFGVNNLAIIPPLALTVVFLAWPFANSLAIPLMGYVVVEGFGFVVDENNFNLLLNAVPSKIKYKFRVIVEFFFEPLGMLMAVPILSAMQLNSRWVGLGLAFVATCLALAIRASYIKGIFINLADNAMRFHRKVSEWWDNMSDKERRESNEYLEEILRKNDSSSQVFACQALLANEDPVMIQKILPHLVDVNPEVKISFISLIDNTPLATDANILDLLEKWLRDDPSVRVRGAILFYLAKYGVLHPDKVKQGLHSSDLTLRGSAILALETFWPQQQSVEVAQNHSIVMQKLRQLLNSDAPNEICMGIAILEIEGSSHNVDILIPFLKHKDTIVMRSAARAIARIIAHNKREKRWVRYGSVIATLLGISSDKETRFYCLQALGDIGDSSIVKHIISASMHFRPSERRHVQKVIASMGLRTVPTLLLLTKDRTLHPRCRVLAGCILGKLAPPQLRNNLHSIIKEEIEQAYFYFYHSYRIQQQHPEYDLRMLEDALTMGFHSVVDFIIQMLGVAGSLEDGEVLSWALHSSNKKVRSQAVETIEKTCDKNIFKLLEPLISDNPLEDKLRSYLKGGRIPYNLSELLNVMEHSPTQIDNIMAAALKRRFNFSRWKDSLRSQMATSHKIFHRCAYELLES